MSDLNRVFLLGRIGNELELKESSQGKPYLYLSVATNVYKSADEKITHWHRVMVFGHTAQLCATYLRKGSQVMVEGHLEVQTYTDDETKKMVRKVSVVASRVQFVGGRTRAESREDGELRDLEDIVATAIPA